MSIKQVSAYGSAPPGYRLVVPKSSHERERVDQAPAPSPALPLPKVAAAVTRLPGPALRGLRSFHTTRSRSWLLP